MSKLFQLEESHIIQPGKTGFGILIEHDAGFINADLNPKFLNEAFELKPNEPVLIDCILQKWGVKNKNGRIYPKDVLLPQVEEYRKLVDTNSAVSEADHPDSSIISLQNISHMITKMWWGKGEQSNVLFGELKIRTVEYIQKMFYYHKLKNIENWLIPTVQYQKPTIPTVQSFHYRISHT